MTYWEAFQSALVFLGLIALGLAGLISIFFAIYYTFAARNPYDGSSINHPWWIRALGGVYLLGVLTSLIALLIWKAGG